MTEAKSTQRCSNGCAFLNGNCIECGNGYPCESAQPQLPPRPQRTEDGNGDKKHYQADAVDSFITALEAENESLKATNKEKEALIRQLHEANFRQAAKINSIVGAGAEFTDALLRLFGVTMYTEEYENASIIREVKAVIEHAQRYEAERDKALEVIREYRFSSIGHRLCSTDFGYCPTCIKADALLKVAGVQN